MAHKESYLFNAYHYKAMNETTLGGFWDELKGKVKQAYAELTDDDFTHAEGQADEVWGKLQQKTGKTKDEINKAVADL